MSILAREFRQIWKALEDNQRRLAASQITGPVAEIDGDRIRIELEPANPRTGKIFLSPWVKLQDAATGNQSTASSMPVAIGDPMRLMSPNGEMGPHSLAIRDSHTDDAPNPGDNDQLVLAFGDCALRMSDGLLILSQGAAEYRIEAGETKVVSTFHTHNEVNVGDTHRHRDVEPGAGTSGRPL